LLYPDPADGSARATRSETEPFPSSRVATEGEGDQSGLSRFALMYHVRSKATPAGGRVKVGRSPSAGYSGLRNRAVKSEVGEERLRVASIVYG